MTIKRMIPIALGLAMFAVAGVQGYAFMMANQDATVAEAKIDVVQLIDDLQAEAATEEVNAEAMLAKLDEALDQIDDALDQGVQDESELLVARDAIVDMRLEASKEEVAHDQLAGSQCNCPECNAAPTRVISGGGGGPILGGGGPILGGAGGGGLLSGGPSFGLLAAGAAAIAIPIATASDDDDPAPAASAAN